jgi:hypothetical protein
VKARKRRSDESENGKKWEGVGKGGGDEANAAGLLSAPTDER